MTLPNLISFSGYTSAGKDTAADVLVSRARFVKTYMSKPLEQTLLKLNPWIDDNREGTIERFETLHTNLGDRAIKDFAEAQRFLRVLETEVGGEDHWTNLVFEEIEGLLALDKKVALAGVQSLLELELVHMYEGVCVWIERPVKLRGGAGVTPEDCDIVVMNDGTPKDLYVKLVVGLEEYNTRKEAEKVAKETSVEEVPEESSKEEELV